MNVLFPGEKMSSSIDTNGRFQDQFKKHIRAMIPGLKCMFGYKRIVIPLQVNSIVGSQHINHWALVVVENVNMERWRMCFYDRWNGTNTHAIACMTNCLTFLKEAAFYVGLTELEREIMCVREQVKDMKEGHSGVFGSWNVKVDCCDLSLQSYGKQPSGIHMLLVASDICLKKDKTLQQYHMTDVADFRDVIVWSLLYNKIFVYVPPPQPKKKRKLLYISSEEEDN